MEIHKTSPVKLLYFGIDINHDILSTDFIIYVYDVTNLESFENLKLMIEKFSFQNKKLSLVGNCVDKVGMKINNKLI